MKTLKRLSSANNLLEKYYQDVEHARHVSVLAAMLFNQTKGILHNYSDKKRDMLKAASLLHDIGQCISAEGHHKHSYEIIIKEGIEGFKPEEIEVIANIARYHRGKLPKEKHVNYARLETKKQKKQVKRLGGFLKVADGLDRAHMELVESVQCKYDDFSRVLYITIKSGSPHFKPCLKVLKKKKDLLEKAFTIQVVFIFT